MFAQSTQYIVREEKKRINDRYPVVASKQNTPTSTGAKVYAVAEPIPSAMAGPKISQTQQSKVSTRKVASTSKAPQTPYNEFDWIPMMLGMLRAQDINIGDPDIIRYFIDEPYFPQLYEQLNRAERTKVDAFKNKP